MSVLLCRIICEQKQNLQHSSISTKFSIIPIFLSTTRNFQVNHIRVVGPLRINYVVSTYIVTIFLSKYSRSTSAILWVPLKLPCMASTLLLLFQPWKMNPYSFCFLQFSGNQSITSSFCILTDLFSDFIPILKGRNTLFQSIFFHSFQM